MKTSPLSHHKKTTYHNQLKKNLQQPNVKFLQNIQLISQEILQKYTNNMRMQVKQQLIQIKCPQINNELSQKSKQLRKKDLTKWLSQICHSVFSIAYNSYKKSQMTEQQMKIYCSENLLLNLIKLSQSNNLIVQDYQYIDTVLKNQILSYYKDKYPPTLQKQSYKRFRAEIQDIDTMEDFEEELIKVSKLQEQFGKRYEEYCVKKRTGNQDNNPQYYDIMMQFINFCLELPDRKHNKSQQDGNSYYDQFNILMTDIFSKVEDINYMRGRNTQQKSKKSQRELQQQQEYRQRVKEYTHYKIGRKIPQYVHKFTEQEIKNKNIKVKDPTILRFLTKWVEQLEDNLQNISSKLTSVGQDLNYATSFANYGTVQKLKRKRKQLLDIFQNKIYQQQQFCDHSYLDKKQINMIPKNDKLVGVFSFLASQHQSTFILKSINSIIHDLCQLSWSRSQFKIPIISCKIGDLIRCKCSSREKEILKIYQQMKNYSRQNPQIFKIVRTKNRLEKGTKDILINILFKKTVLCQIQLSINQSQSSESKLNSFNHYLYELQRSKFGPINQLANVWTKDQRYQHISKLLEKKQKKNIQRSCQCGEEDWQQQKNPFPFLCNYCDRYYDRNISFISHKKCRNCKIFWKCSNCWLEQIVEKQDGRKQLLKQYSQKDDCQLIQLENTKIPEYGMFIKKDSKTKNFIEFKAFDLPDQKDIYLVRVEGKIKKIIYIIPKDKQGQFFNDKIVFKIKNINQMKGFSDQEFKKTLLLPKNIKLLYKNQGQAVKWALNHLKNQQFDNLTKGEQKNYQNIKSINLCNNHIREMSTILNRFKNLQFLNLSINKIQQIPDEIGNHTQLKQLNLNANKIINFPQSLGNLRNLTKLQLSLNNIQTIPETVGNLNNLTALQISNNKLKAIPQSFGSLSSLKRLKLSYNDIEAIPESFGNLYNLTALEMYQNKLKTIPQSFGNLSSLTTLLITSNSIETIPQSFGNLSSLTQLWISNNKIETLPQSFGNLQNLTELWIYKNKLKVIPQSFGNLSSLKTLVINHNNLETIPESFGKLKSLTTLKIQNNKIRTIPQSFGNLKNLAELQIQKNDLETIPESFGNLTNLTTLTIHSNKLRVIPQSFGNLNNLTNLWIYSNKIETLNKSFGKLRNLSFVNLSENNITVNRQFLQLFMEMNASIFLQNNKMSMSQQDMKWLSQNQLEQRIRL